MSDSEIKPAAFKRGMPKSAHNGIYGLEEHLIANDNEQIVAIVTYGVEDVIDKQKKGERYPIVEVLHIEPLRTPEAIEAAQKLASEAYKERTGEAQLDFSALGDDEGGR